MKRSLLDDDDGFDHGLSIAELTASMNNDDSDDSDDSDDMKTLQNLRRHPGRKMKKTQSFDDNSDSFTITSSSLNDDGKNGDDNKEEEEDDCIVLDDNDEQNDDDKNDLLMPPPAMTEAEESLLNNKGKKGKGKGKGKRGRKSKQENLEAKKAAETLQLINAYDVLNKTNSLLSEQNESEGSSENIPDSFKVLSSQHDFDVIPDDDNEHEDDCSVDISTRVDIFVPSQSEPYSFTLKKNDPFSKCVKVLCTITHNDDKTIELKWNGITLKSTDTPETYFMGEIEKLNAVIRLPDDEVQSDIEDKKEDEQPQQQEEVICIKVQKDGMKHPATFRISPNKTVDTLLQGFCKKFGFSPDSIVLQFDGETMDRNKTLNDYGIESDDLIDAVEKK